MMNERPYSGNEELPDEQVLPVCYFWGKRLATKNVSFDELVNVAYVEVKKLRSPLLLQKWVKWTMIHFIKEGHSAPLEDRDIEDKSFSFKEFKELQEDLMLAVEAVCDEEEKYLLTLLFWKGMSYRRAAKSMCMPFQTVSYKVQKVLRKLREYYERRSRQ